MPQRSVNFDTDFRTHIGLSVKTAFTELRRQRQKKSSVSGESWVIVIDTEGSFILILSTTKAERGKITTPFINGAKRTAHETKEFLASV